MNRPSLIYLLIRFLRLGLTAFGGPAMIPYIRQTAVESEEWLSDESFRLGMAMSQLIPGATAMQMAAYVGLRARGGLGALVAYFGFGLPAFVLMLALSIFYFEARDLPGVLSAFKGLQLVVVALVANASFNFMRRYLDTPASWVLAAMAGIWFGFKGNPILALVVVCILAIFVCRQEQGGAPEPKGGAVIGRPVLFAGVLSLCLAGLVATLYVLSPQLFGLGALMIKIDCFAFGGGYVSVPLMLHEVVEVRHWLTFDQFMDGIALGQVTPGPIVMTGAFVGYAVAGGLGAIVATVTVFSPSLIFVCLATPFSDKLVGSPVARRVLKGSLISLVGLMAAVAVRFTLNIQWGIVEALVTVSALIALRLGVDILWVILAGAGLSALFL